MLHFARTPSSSAGGCDLKILALTPGEFAVLEALVAHARHPLSRDKPTELAHGKEHGRYDRSMDMPLSRLRRLIDDGPGQPRYLKTVWGSGCVFVPDDPSR